MRHHDAVAMTAGRRRVVLHVLLGLWIASAIQLAAAFGLEGQLRQLTLQERTSSRELLQPRHQRDFVSDSLFDDFARTVCLANAVPRKELYEAWATALYVHDRFPESGRVADLACGHGLLSWALLLLDMERTAVCIDKRMPGSAEKVARAMTSRWPQLSSRWDYVEGKLDAIEPCSSTLMCGIHACGILSDKVLSLAIQGNTPLVLIPCCHTRRALEMAERQEFDRLHIDLSDFVDTRRIERLQQAGFSVERQEIPQAFTPMNTVILAAPPKTPCKRISSRPMSTPPLFSIPVGDNSESIAKVKSLAGRVAAEERKKPPPPSLSVALFLPGSETSLTPEMLASLLEGEEFSVEYADQSAYLHPKCGRYARTFRIVYAGISKEQAKDVHTNLCEQIPIVFPGASVRSTGL